MDFTNVIVIKLYNHEPKPLDCPYILKLVTKEVFKAGDRDSSWKVVLFQQWVGDIEDSFDGYAYIEKAQASADPQTSGVTLIEITSSRDFNVSEAQVEAARKKMASMFPESPILVFYTPSLTERSKL